jgi:hypothetical protein
MSIKATSPQLVGPGETQISWSCRDCVREKHRAIQPPWAAGDDLRLVEKSATVPLTEQSGIVYCDHGHPHPWGRRR